MRSRLEDKIEKTGITYIVNILWNGCNDKVKGYGYRKFEKTEETNRLK
ncbi:hypothetical protein [Daejeonella rubra]|nr:hypothetical protein [Daejeonella rubra]